MPAISLFTESAPPPMKAERYEFSSRISPEVEQISNRFNKILDAVEAQKTLSVSERNAIRIAKNVVSGYEVDVPELYGVFFIKYGKVKDAKIAEMSDKDILRLGTMLLYSRAFNEADKTIEWRLDQQKIGKKLDIDMAPQTQLSRAMYYPIGKYARVETGKTEVIRIGDVLFSAIPALENILEAPNALEHERSVSKILSAQVHGLQLVENLSSRGIPYSKAEAVRYVQDTVGTYARLLADVVFDEPHQARVYASKLLEKKNNDDKLDLIKDIFTQPNPYLAEAFRKGHGPILSFIAKEAYKAYRVIGKAVKLVSDSASEIASRNDFLEAVGKMYYEYFPEVAAVPQSKLKPVY